MEFVPGPDITVDDRYLGLSADRRPKHLSPSSYSMYRQCPRKWRHRYVDRLPDSPGVPALVGTFAHLVLEHLLQLTPLRRTQEQAKLLARQLWSDLEKNPDYRSLELSTGEAREFRWKGWEAIVGLWALEDPGEVQVHATEHEVQVDICGVPFRGIIDRVDVVDDEFVVSDYKSGSAPPDRFRDRPLKQVLLYAAALEQLIERRPAQARLLYLGQRTLSVRVTAKNLGEVTEELAQTWQQLDADCAADRFAAQVGPLCAWCPFISHCPEGQQEVAERDKAGRVRVDAPGLAVIYAEAG